MTSIAVFIIYIFVPFFCLLKLLKNNSEDILRWMGQAFFASIYILYLFFAGAWVLVFYGYFLRNFWIGALLISLLYSWKKKTRQLNPTPLFQQITYRNLIGIFVGTFFAWKICVAWGSGFIPPGETVYLEFPLQDGEFGIAHGGSEEITNHHYSVSAQKYALDIVQLDRFGYRSKVFFPQTVDQYCIYGAVIYSPCDGCILESEQGLTDLAPGIMDPSRPAGNYLAIEIADSEYVVILAHLMQGSCLVKKGQLVKKGDPLARVGNSGNTSEPHLHMHTVLKNTGDFLFNAKGIPMLFSNRFLIRNDRVFCPPSL